MHAKIRVDGPTWAHSRGVGVAKCVAKGRGALLAEPLRQSTARELPRAAVPRAHLTLLGAVTQLRRSEIVTLGVGLPVVVLCGVFNESWVSAPKRGGGVNARSKTREGAPPAWRRRTKATERREPAAPPPSTPMLQLDSRWGDRRDLDAANHPCFGETNMMCCVGD